MSLKTETLNCGTWFHKLNMLNAKSAECVHVVSLARK